LAATETVQPQSLENRAAIPISGIVSGDIMPTISGRAPPDPHDILPPAPTILAFGDSLTAGYGLPNAQSFAAQLEKALQQRHPGAVVVNAGLSGDTTATALNRLPKLLSSLKAKPDLAIVELGANDLLRGIPNAATRANLDAIIVDLARIGIPVLLARMEAPALLGAFGKACDAIYTELAARHGIPSAAFFPRGVLANPALCLRDRIHPNAQGVAAIVKGFLPAVLEALALRKDIAA
jgi:acyl-CoA thioesterase-1